jgi:hypothetical protein
MEPVETYGHFTPGAARSLTGKMGTRPITFIRKFINTGLCLLINTKIDETPGNFRGEKRPKRVKKAVEYVRSNHAGIISHR